jgi:MFS transporter, PAT family, beta-lactamase induction signal transducer AmpG
MTSLQNPQPNPAPASTPAYKSKVFWVAMLYFSEGFPMGVFSDLLPVYFRQQGVNLKDIGLLALLGLAWTLKFLWAPAVDWARHHRRWIALANLGMAGVMVFFAWQHDLGSSVNGSSPWVWVVIGVFTLLSATNDIATDGYTIELLSPREYGLANGLRIGFYRAGMIFAGVLLMMSGWMGWEWAYRLGAVVFTFNAMAILCAPPEAAHKRKPGNLGQEFGRLRAQPLWILALMLVLAGLLFPAVAPLANVMGWQGLKNYSGEWWFQGGIPVALMFSGAALMVLAARNPKAQALREGPVFGAWVDLLSRPGMIAVLLFILLFKLGDSAMGFMVKPFWVDAGFEPEQIGLVSVNIGLALSIAGGLLGGWYVDTRGIFKSLWVLGIWQALSNLAYAAVASMVPLVAKGAVVDIPLDHQMLVYAASGLESFTGGLGTGAFLAFLMAITSRHQATTEYAILSSIFAFSRAVAGWAGGIGAQKIGYANYFFLTFWLSFPAYFLLPSVQRMLKEAQKRH